MSLLSDVPFSQVSAFVASLGARVDEVVTVELGPESVTVTELRRNEANQLIAAGKDCATVTTVIGYDRSA